MTGGVGRFLEIPSLLKRKAKDKTQSAQGPEHGGHREQGLSLELNDNTWLNVTLEHQLVSRPEAIHFGPIVGVASLWPRSWRISSKPWDGRYTSS
jgi:hypothetical protein